MKKITLLVFAMMCLTMSAQDYPFVLADMVVFENPANTSYDDGTKAITWTGGGATGAIGFEYASGSELNAASPVNQEYLVLVINSVITGTGGTGTGVASLVRIHYSDGTTVDQPLTTTSTQTVYNIELDDTKKSAISKIQFRLYGTAPTIITFDSMYLSATTGTLALSKVELPSLKTYPNPFNDIMAVECADIIKNISIYSISGQIVDKVTANSMKVNIATSNLSKGFYMLKIETEKGYQTVKMVK